MNVVAVASQKGGVGKSTVALALGAGLALKGARVLFVDLDAQGDLSRTLGAAGSRGAYDVLWGLSGAAQAVEETRLGGVIASSPYLSGADSAISGAGREGRLRSALREIDGDWGWCVVDTPPSLGELTVNALAACGGAVVPAQADAYSLAAIRQLGWTVRAVREGCNGALRVMGVVLTRWSGRAAISRDAADMIGEAAAASLGSGLYRSRIRDAAAVRESQARGKSIYEYAPRSKAALDCMAFVEEFLAGWEALYGEKGL